MRAWWLFFLLLLAQILNAQDINSQIQALQRQIQQTKQPALKAQYLTKLGTLYQQLDSTSKAISAYSQALDLLKGSKNLRALYQLNNYLGVLYSDAGQLQKAKQHFSQSVHYARRLGDKRLLSQALFNLAGVLMQLKQYSEAIPNFEEALSIAFDLDNLQLVKKAYANIAMCYKALGDQQRYLKYFNLSVAIDKKIKERLIAQKEQEAQRQAQIARQRQLLLELQRYQMKTYQDSLKYISELNEKNQMRLALLEKEAKLKELEVKRREAELKQKEAQLRAKQTIILSLSIILGIIALATIIIFKLYRDKRKANKELKRKNQQIKDSIEYASRIQMAILPSSAAIAYNFPAGSFVFYKPRDVVSGDFFWFSDQGQYKFLALVDCTGHSVPGAFMSLIGNTLLNEIVNSKHIFDPAQVLYQLHYNVVKLLHQQSPEEDSVQDGMDIALCRFDVDNDVLTFASANQPIFIFYPDGKFIQHNGDIYSIGGFSERIQVKFKNYQFQLVSGTNIYLSSDGFFDQFNENRQKYTRKRFIQLLKRIYHLPMAEQFKTLEEEFREWKGNFQQIDDVLVIGVRYTDKQETERLLNMFKQQKDKPYPPNHADNIKRSSVSDLESQEDQ